MSAWKLSQIEHADHFPTGCKCCELGTVEMPLAMLQAMHPEADFKICDGKVDGVVYAPPFGMFVYHGRRPSLFVEPVLKDAQ